MNEQDFRNRQYYPGTTDNPFDSLIHGIVRIDKIPFYLFALILLILAFIPHPMQWITVSVHWAFFLLDWLLLANLPRYQKSFGPAKPPVLMLAVLRTFFNLLPFPIALVFQVIGTFLVIYGFWIEPQKLILSRQTLKSPKLEKGATLRILHLADLHLERITERERKIGKYIQELKPDLILFSGDFLNLSYRKDPTAWAQVQSLFTEWQKTADIYLVTGSPAVDLPEVIPNLLAGMPVTRLNNEKRALSIRGQEFDLVGVTCSHKPFEDSPRLKSLLEKPLQRFTLLLYHTPDLAPEAAEEGIDLQLSGHTHGGQVVLPLFGALFTGSLYGKRFESGRSMIKAMTLYISRGIGMEGAGAPRVRFLCPPEIIMWEIQGE